VYYDNKDSIETLLKDTINFHKDVLSCFTDLVYVMPDLGPILGPSMSFSSQENFSPLFTEPCPAVYEVKCILDEILDLTENLADAIINALKCLISEYNKAICGIEVLGICI